MFMHLNVVCAAILWSIWNNRNGLVFNRHTWMNIKQVWRRAHSYLKEWKVPFKELDGGKIGQFMDLLMELIRSPLSLEPG